MSSDTELKYAKNMKNRCLAFVILCFLLMVTAITFKCHWATIISGAIAGALATHAYHHWKKKYNALKK